MILFLSITVGFLVLAAHAEYLVALHAASSANAVPAQIRPGRRGRS